MNIVDSICYDDVLLIAKHSKIPSRSHIKVNVDLGKGIKLNGPFISANMKTVTGPLLAEHMGFYGMGILHRFASIEEQIKNYKTATRFHEYGDRYENPFKNSVGISVGISSISENDRVIKESGTKIVCIDVAHGDHDRVIKETKRISTLYPDILLIVGNVATGEGARRLAQAGADVVKVGVGPGSLCTTRVETGNGIPQLTALMLAYEALGREERDVKIIADGGIKQAGDVGKALCFSDAVMLGSVLAGTDEAPGEIITVDGNKYKKYAGSSTHKTNRIEGVAGLTPYKGPMRIILEKYKEGLQSCLSYQGCDNLEDLKDDPLFVKVSNAGLIESRPHANLKK